MRELHSHTGVWQLLTKDGFLPGILLKRNNIACKSFLLGVVGHIEQAERHLAQTGSGSHKVATLDNATN